MEKQLIPNDNLIINKDGVKVFYFESVEDLDGLPEHKMMGGTFASRIFANDFIMKSMKKGWILYMMGESSEDEKKEGRPFSVLMFK